MNTKTTQHWQHDHVFGQDKVRHGERRTLWVIIITAIMMVIEITTGLAYGSMALLADGLHMGSHTAALGITTIAYIYTRRRAADARFCFGTGKVNAFAGYTSAVLLALFALLMAWESVNRLFNPVAIAFNHAIMVALLGLVVNGISMLMLEDRHHDHGHGHDHPHHHAHTDHNLRAAYIHVLAEARTLYTESASSMAARHSLQEECRLQGRPARQTERRPDKRTRRLIHKFKEEY